VHIDVRQCTLAEALTEARNAGTSDLKVSGRDDFDSSVDNREQTMTVISVRDNGRGIPTAEMEHLFTEFVQLSVSQEMDRERAASEASAHSVGQTSGTGLGLSLVLKFVAKMSGHIWVTNNNDGGAAFSFCFAEGTRSPSGEDSNQAPEAVQVLPEQIELNVDWLHVLIVDDSSKLYCTFRFVTDWSGALICLTIGTVFLQ